MRYYIPAIPRAFALFLIVCYSLFFQSCKKEPEILPTDPPTNPPVIQGLAKLSTDSISDLSNFSVTFRGRILDQGVSAVSESGLVIDTVPGCIFRRNWFFPNFSEISNQTFKHQSGCLSISNHHFIKFVIRKLHAVFD